MPHLSPMQDNDKLTRLSVIDKENMVKQLIIWGQRKETRKTTKDASATGKRIRPKWNEPGVQCNMVSIIALLELNFFFHFVGPKVEFYLNKALYGHDYLSNG